MKMIEAIPFMKEGKIAREIFDNGEYLRWRIDGAFLERESYVSGRWQTTKMLIHAIINDDTNWEIEE